MKKKAIMLIGCFVVMAALLAVYSVAQRGGDENPVPEVLEGGAYQLVEVKLEDTSKITVENPSGVLTFVTEDNGLLVENTDMTLLDSESVLIMVNALTSISSDNLIGENADVTAYGLDNPQARVTYETKDGSQTLLLGDLTADNNYFYAMDNAGKAYTIGKNTGERILQGVTDLADLTMPTLDPNALTKLNVIQKEKEELSISLDEGNEQAKENLDKNGLQTLTMHKPIENLLVYPYNLETGLLYNYNSFKLEEMVEMGEEKFADYGLSDPVMTLEMADLENAVSLKIGNLNEDGTKYYVAFGGNKAVYTMPSKALEPFFNYDIIDFIQKFIALHYRYTLNNVEIKSVYGDYTVEFKEEGENKIFEENGSTKDTRKEYINGKAVDSEAFVDYYELLVGLTFDALKEAKPQGDAQVTITYNLLDGTSDTVEFYDYDDTFFVAVKGETDEGMNMLINKQQVKQAVDKAKELLQ